MNALFSPAATAGLLRLPAHYEVEGAGNNQRQRIIRLTFILFAFALPFEALNLGQWSRIETPEGDSSFVSLTKIVGYLFFLTTVLDWRRCYARLPKALWFFGVYFALYAIQGTLGEYPTEALNRTASRIQLLVLLYAGFNLLSDHYIQGAVTTAFTLACATLAALSIGGVLDQAVIQTTGSGPLERVTGLAEDANTVAAILSLGVVSLAYLLLSASRRSWIILGLGWLGIAALVYAIVRTGSRGGMLALASGLLTFALGERSRAKLPRNLVVTLAVLGSAVVCMLTWDSALQRWQAAWYDGNTAGRDIIMEESWKLIQQRPLMGWGPVTADHVLGEALGLPTRGAHNLLLSVLLENGVVGTIPYALGIGCCLVAAWRARSGSAGVLPLALLSVVLVVNLSLVWHNQKAHWLVLALALAGASTSSRKGTAAANAFRKRSIPPLSPLAEGVHLRPPAIAFPTRIPGLRKGGCHGLG